MWGNHSDYGILERTGRRAKATFWICLLPLVLLAGAWRMGGVSALEDDLIYYLPIRQFIGQQLAQGLLPLWNPFVNLGVSVAADPQAGLWYPPTWLFALLPPLWAYGFNVWLHFVIAGAGMYRLLRARGLEQRACLLGALAFEFSGFLVAHRVHLAMFQAAAWLPWMLMGWALFSRSGKSRHFGLACLTMGLQFLVQHTQVSLISMVIVGAYVVVVLWPLRRSLWWQFPAGVVLAGMISAVQTVPTFAAFAGTTRNLPAYHLFVENSWVPLSALMMIFPLFFGVRTPAFWTQPWWGVSHFCEQWAYPTLAILLLSICSLALLRRRYGVSTSERVEPLTGHRREVAFWWLAMLAGLVLALGQFTPVSDGLIHVPFYRSLRVPARWILVWSLAMPMLAAFVISAVHRDAQARQHIRAWVRALVRWAVPITLALVLGVLILARAQAEVFEARWSGYRSAEFWAGLRQAVRPGNPALICPLLLMVATLWALRRWVETPPDTTRSSPWIYLVGVFIVDMAWAVPFVDVDLRTYRRSDLTHTPPLAESLHRLGAKAGDRLLVPRVAADYANPLEVLWPQSNINHQIETLNGYGPLGGAAHRLLLGFAPWGSSERVINLLRNPGLCRMAGLRFVATRTKQERDAFAVSLWPEAGPGLQEVGAVPTPVRAGEDLLWGIRAPWSDGLWELRLEVEAVRGEMGRCFVRLEDDQGQGVGETFSIEPADLAISPRTLRFLFVQPRQLTAGDAVATRLRIKAERGEPMKILAARFGMIASATPILPEQTTDWVDHGVIAEGISLYELRHAGSRLRWAETVERVDSLGEAMERICVESADWQHHALVERRADVAVGRQPVTGNITPHVEPGFSRVAATVDSPQPQLLVFRASWDPGWRATIDAQPVDIVRVNALLMGVSIPAGHHELVFSYWPRGLTAAIALTCAGLVLCVALLVCRFSARAS